MTPWPLIRGVDSPDPTPQQFEEYKARLIVTVEAILPELKELVALTLKNKAQILMHQDGFAASYHYDEIVLLGMAVKYAGLFGVAFGFVGKNNSTFHPYKEVEPDPDTVSRPVRVNRRPRRR